MTTISEVRDAIAPAPASVAPTPINPPFAIEMLHEAVEVLEELENDGCAGCGCKIEHNEDGHVGHDENCGIAHALDRIEDALSALGVRDDDAPDRDVARAPAAAPPTAPAGQTREVARAMPGAPAPTKGG